MKWSLICEKMIKKKVIIYGGEFSAFKDFEKVIQVLELYRRRENNH